MKNNLLTALSALVFVGAFASSSFASDEHHGEETKDATATETKANNPHSGMMGKMDMGQMMGMMHECMSMHKDGKMCEHSTMDSCQKEMKKEDCQKMMNQAKKQDKAKK